MPDTSCPLFLTRPTRRSSKSSIATALPIAILFLLLCLPAVAQQPPSGKTSHAAKQLNQAEKTEKESLPPEPRVERLHHEDTGSRMEELRIEGQSKSVRVQPKTVRIAPYEVDTRPENGSLIHQDSNPTGKTNRSWRLLQF